MTAVRPNKKNCCVLFIVETKEKPSTEPYYHENYFFLA